MFYCYIINNANNRTYNGYTINLNNRLRQHNGIIKGGAKFTHNRGPWEFFIIITSPCWNSISEAMKHEWSIKYPTRRRPRPIEYNGVLGRLSSFTKVFEHMSKINCENVNCYVKSEYIEYMMDISVDYKFVKIYNIDDIEKIKV
jgi:putative endonuclease